MRIEKHLAVLEGFGIRTTRGCELPKGNVTDYESERDALLAIKCQTNDSICLAHEPLGVERPGIDLAFAHGGVRTGDANVVAERVQMWLQSELSANLIDSLTTSGADERHGALWLSTEVEAESAREQGTFFRPNFPMTLPVGLDVLWIFVDPIVLRYDGSWTVAPLQIGGQGVRPRYV